MNSEVPELPGASVAAETEPGSVQPALCAGEIAIEEAAPASTPAEEPAATPEVSVHQAGPSSPAEQRVPGPAPSLPSIPGVPNGGEDLDDDDDFEIPEDVTYESIVVDQGRTESKAEDEGPSLIRGKVVANGPTAFSSTSARKPKHSCLSSRVLAYPEPWRSAQRSTS